MLISDQTPQIGAPWAVADRLFIYAPHNTIIAAEYISVSMNTPKELACYMPGYGTVSSCTQTWYILRHLHIYIYIHNIYDDYNYDDDDDDDDDDDGDDDGVVDDDDVGDVTTYETHVFSDRIAVAILELRYFGELRKLEKKWWYEKNECDKEENTPQKVSL